MKAILFTLTLFWDRIFAPYLCQIIKLVFKLGLRTNKILSNVMKEIIEIIGANRTNSQLDQLFKDDPE